MKFAFTRVLTVISLLLHRGLINDDSNNKQPSTLKSLGPKAVAGRGAEISVSRLGSLPMPLEQMSLIAHCSPGLI